MSLFYMPGVPDHAVTREMTVYSDPFYTEARYRPGLAGVAASLPHLEEAVVSSDHTTACSVLGDMAAALGYAADSPPRGPMHIESVCCRLTALEEALESADIVGVTRLVLEMARRMALPVRVRC